MLEFTSKLSKEKRRRGIAENLFLHSLSEVFLGDVRKALCFPCIEGVHLVSPGAVTSVYPPSVPSASTQRGRLRLTGPARPAKEPEIQ